MPKHSYDFNIAVLRTFVAVQELGSAASAAIKIGRSQSAVSLQLKSLEQQLGRSLFLRSGHMTSLTPFGEEFLPDAIRLIELNDSIAAGALAHQPKRIVRLGTPSWIADAWLPAALAQFANRHPSIKVETRIAPSSLLESELNSGTLDLVLMANVDRHDILHSWELPLCWIAPRDFVGQSSDAPISLVVLDSPCLFRTAAVTALQNSGMTWKVTFTAKTMTALWSAISAGLGITLRTSFGIPDQLTVVENASLPDVQNFRLALYGKPPCEQSGATKLMSELLAESVAATVGAAF